MGMIVYQLYTAAVNTTATLTTTGKGKIVAMAYSLAMIGGAAVGVNGISVVKNTSPSASATFAISNPQKQLVIHNAVFESGITTAQSEHDVISGIGIDYIPGDTFSLLSLNNGGTAPTGMIVFFELYCMES